MKSPRVFLKLFRKASGFFNRKKKLKKCREKALPTSDAVSGETTKELPAEKVTHAPVFEVTPEQIDIQVGIDFGTSATKIAFRELAFKATIRPIVFNHGLKAYPGYCLPSLAVFSAKDELLLGIEAAQELENEPWSKGFRLLKILVAGRADSLYKNLDAENAYKSGLQDYSGNTRSLTPEKLTAIYIAYVIKKARSAISSLPRYQKGQKLNLIFNIGIPIDYTENNKVQGVFEKIIAWAELIERQWNGRANSDPVKLAEGCESQAEYGSSDGLKRAAPEARVFAVPEAVAEVASYTLSRQMEEGLYALIDLGAGTTDISIFRLRRMEHLRLKQVWLSARNIPHGGNFIEQEVSQYISQGNQSSTKSEVIRCLTNYCNNTLQAGVQTDISAIIRQFLGDIWKSQEYINIWVAAYDRHSPREVPSWKKVRVFVAGGVALLPEVRKTFSRPWWDRIRRLTPRYECDYLPEPSDYDSEGGKAPFARMEVACGLSYAIEQLEDVLLPSRVGIVPVVTPPVYIPHIDYDNNPG